jgi:DNA-binding Lrp family transcriptional regulator
MDELDTRIVMQLEADARIPSSELARRLAVPEATVRRRVRLLRARGVLRMVALLAPDAIPGRVEVCIGLKVDLRHLDGAAQALARHRELRFVYIAAGEFDLLVEGAFASHAALHAFLTEQIGALNGVRDARACVILRTLKFGQPVHGAVDVAATSV